MLHGREALDAVHYCSWRMARKLLINGFINEILKIPEQKLKIFLEKSIKE